MILAFAFQLFSFLLFALGFLPLAFWLLLFFCVALCFGSRFGCCFVFLAFFLHHAILGWSFSKGRDKIKRTLVGALFANKSTLNQVFVFVSRGGRGGLYFVIIMLNFAVLL